MPTYEYRCDACGHAFEKFHSITAAPIKQCPQCGKKKVKRLIGTGSALIFKGSGFYITDYRSDGYKQSAKSDTAVSTSSSSTPSTPATATAGAAASTATASAAPASTSSTGSSSSASASPSSKPATAKSAK